MKVLWDTVSLDLTVIMEAMCETYTDWTKDNKEIPKWILYFLDVICICANVPLERNHDRRWHQTQPNIT